MTLTMSRVLVAGPAARGCSGCLGYSEPRIFTKRDLVHAAEANLPCGLTYMKWRLTRSGGAMVKVDPSYPDLVSTPEHSSDTAILD